LKLYAGTTEQFKTNMTVPYDPRNGPGRSRSGVLRIGKARLGGIVSAHEQLAVSREGETNVLD
jgi:hypothetical protein